MNMDRPVHTEAVTSFPCFCSITPSSPFNYTFDYETWTLGDAEPFLFHTEQVCITTAILSRFNQLRCIT